MVPASDVAGSVIAIADLFAQVGTDPMVDWSRPSVLLTHPLQRTTIVSYARGGDLGRAAALVRSMWVAGDPHETWMVSLAVDDLAEDHRATFRVEQVDYDRWSAEACVVVELDDGPFGMEHLTLLQWWLELAARGALVRLAAAMRPKLGELAAPRARLLRHAFALLGDGADADGTLGERIELAAVDNGHVTLSSGEARLPVLLRYDENDDRLEALTLLAGFDGRTSRSELGALRSTFARRARGHEEELRVVDVPGELATAIGVVTMLAPSVETATLRRVLEAHLDVARGGGGMNVGRA